jgi:hypothetical protein
MYCPPQPPPRVHPPGRLPAGAVLPRRAAVRAVRRTAIRRGGVDQPEPQVVPPGLSAGSRARAPVPPSHGACRTGSGPGVVSQDLSQQAREFVAIRR